MSYHYLRHRCLTPVLLAPLLFINASLVQAKQCPQNLQDIQAHLDLSEQYEQMAFEVSHVGENDDFSRSERYEPWQPPEQRWVLLSQDGELPDQKDRERFARRRAEQGNPLLYYLQGLQTNDTQLLEQTANRLRYQFQPDKIEVGSGGKNSLDVSEHILGTLTLLNDSDIGCVLTINLSNPESFSPRTGVKVKTFSLTSRFMLDNQTGLFFPKASNLVLKGRAFLVAGFDVMNRATYSAVGLHSTQQLISHSDSPINDGTNQKTTEVPSDGSR